jgi:hypothetical protein
MTSKVAVHPRSQKLPSITPSKPDMQSASRPTTRMQPGSPFTAKIQSASATQPRTQTTSAAQPKTKLVSPTQPETPLASPSKPQIQPTLHTKARVQSTLSTAKIQSALFLLKREHNRLRQPNGHDSTTTSTLLRTIASMLPSNTLHWTGVTMRYVFSGLTPLVGVITR